MKKVPFQRDDFQATPTFKQLLMRSKFKNYVFLWLNMEKIIKRTRNMRWAL